MAGKYSEQDMANAFEELLSSENGIREFPRFQSVYREITCRQGIADFVAVTGNSKTNLAGIVVDNNYISLDSCTRIMSCLKPRSPRTKEYIIVSTGFSVNTIDKALKALENNQLISQTKYLSYILHPNWASPKAELWAFELKLCDWKRAMFQVMQ